MCVDTLYDLSLQMIQEIEIWNCNLVSTKLLLFLDNNNNNNNNNNVEL